MRPLLTIFSVLAWLSISPLEGQIVYREIDPPQTVMSGKGVEIDFNDDSIVDLLLWKDHYKVGSGCIAVLSGDLFSVMPTDTAYLFYDSTGVLYAFNYLDTIKESMNCFESPYSCPNQSIYKCPFLIHHQVFLYDCDSTRITNTGLYREIRNKYFGFRLKILGHNHYGWINFSKKEGVDFILRAYAYNTTPEEAIVINDPFYTTFESSQHIGITFFPNPVGDVLTIDNIGNEGIVKIIDFAGRITISQNYYNSPLTIPVRSLAKGSYILQVETVNGRFVEKFIKD